MVSSLKELLSKARHYSERSASLGMLRLGSACSLSSVEETHAPTEIDLKQKENDKAGCLNLSLVI